MTLRFFRLQKRCNCPFYSCLCQRERLFSNHAHNCTLSIHPDPAHFPCPLGRAKTLVTNTSNRHPAPARNRHNPALMFGIVENPQESTNTGCIHTNAPSTGASDEKPGPIIHRSCQTDSCQLVAMESLRDSVIRVTPRLIWVGAVGYPRVRSCALSAVRR